MKYFVELPEVWAIEFLDYDEKCDGYWISSLTQSWQKGYPDNCTLPWSNYVDLTRRLRLQTTKDIMVDVDMLFNEPNVGALIAKELFEVGCNSIVIESKRFPKVNSLIPDQMVLSSPEEFARLINKVKASVPALKVMARIEHLSVTKDVDHTFRISKRMIDAGADGVVIHWGVDANTSYLKEILSLLKEDKVYTGIIPTKFLDQLVTGDFDNLADFCILGNICSSFIRNSFAEKSIDSLLKAPSAFKPLLDRTRSMEPRGKKTLVVLGARANKDGEFLLADNKTREKFFNLPIEYHSILFIIPSGVISDEITLKNVRKIEIDDSLGEVHSLMVSIPYINTEYVTVVYADILDFGFNNIENPGLLFDLDTYAGVMNIKSDILISMINKCDPTNTILEMASNYDIEANLFK